jgi:hypothetical protein
MLHFINQLEMYLENINNIISIVIFEQISSFFFYSFINIS